VTAADICTVPFTGTIEIVPEGLSFTGRSVFVKRLIAPILDCLTLAKAGITGASDFRAEIEGNKNLPGSLLGDGEIVIRSGRIYRLPLLSKILEFLNVTQIVLGRMPDLGKEGMAYDLIRIMYNVEKGKIVLRKIYLDAPTLGIAGQGTVDLEKKTMNLTLLVSPLRTIDRILGAIPIIRNFRNIVAIPISVYGDVNNPKIVPLTPSAISSQLLDIMKDVVGNPLRIFEPLTK
jgi:hypothetical protein